MCNLQTYTFHRSHITDLRVSRVEPVGHLRRARLRLETRRVQAAAAVVTVRHHTGPVVGHPHLSVSCARLPQVCLPSIFVLLLLHKQGHGTTE